MREASTPFHALPFRSFAFSRRPLPSHAVHRLLAPFRKYSVYGVDRFGNQLERGGSYVNARLVSTGSLPLAPQQETSFEAEDMEDGSYEITVTLKGAADVKVRIPWPCTPFHDPPCPSMPFHALQ